jgi:chromosome partitioning protein
VIEQAGKDFLLVLNAATPRTNIARDTLQILAQRGKVAPVTLYNRVDFAVSMFDGRTAGEIKRTSKSASEVTELAQYVYTQLKQQGEWTRSFNHQAE